MALREDNIRRFLALMKGRGYRPRVPVAIEDFANPLQRRAWLEEKGMKAFSIYHPAKHEELIDILVDEPIPFEAAYARRVSIRVGAADIPVASVRDLIELKRRAARPQDLEDIRALENLPKKTP